MLLFATLVLYMLIVPVSLAFFLESEDFWWPLVFCTVDFLFLADLFLNFNSGYVGRDGVVLEKRAIRCRYLKSWFALDLLASMPFELATLVVYWSLPPPEETLHWRRRVQAPARLIRIFRLLRLLRMLKVFRLAKLLRYVQQFEDLYVSGTTLVGARGVCVVSFEGLDAVPVGPFPRRGTTLFRVWER